MKVVLDVLLLGFVPALLLGWHLDLRKTRAERSSALNKDAAGGPQIPSEHTLLGEGRAGLGANCSGGRLDSVIFLSNVVLLAFLSIASAGAEINALSGRTFVQQMRGHLLHDLNAKCTI